MMMFCSTYRMLNNEIDEMGMLRWMRRLKSKIQNKELVY